MLGMSLISWPKQAAMTSMPSNGSPSCDITGIRYAISDASNDERQ